MSLEVRRGTRNSIILPTLSYVSETWTHKAVQQSRMHAPEMNHVRGACGGLGWSGESNGSVDERVGVGVTAKGVECGVVEEVH